MKMTSQEIRSKKFATKLRGYDTAEVTNFLVQIATEWEDVHQRVRVLNERVIELDTKVKDYTTMEKAIQQTFMQAQETSGKAVENARKEAQLIIQESEIKATQVLENARTEMTSLKEHLTILKAKKDSIGARLRMLLTSELELIRALEVDEELQKKNSGVGDELLTKEKSEIDDIVKNLE
jgi:cell division initiation protein